VLYLFDSYVIDTDRRELRHEADPVSLEPQVFDLLAYLIEKRDRVVSKDDLLAAIWQGRIVSESTVTSRINAARGAIGDSGDRQRLIKTFLRKGFRFVGEVREQIQTTVPGTQMAPPGLVLPDRPSIAILPFTNMTGDSEQEYFSDGITEDIITELSRFGELFVIARNSSFHYRGKTVDIRQVGRELGVRYVLEGSIRRGGDRVRISAQLIDGTTGGHRWAERYDRKLDDIFALQVELARTIVAILAAHVHKAEIERALTKAPATYQAYDYCMRAADYSARYNSSFSKTELHGVRRFLERAVAIDPGYARAHAALSMTYVSSWVHRWDDDCPWSDALDRAYQFAQKSILLGANLPEAHLGLGWTLLWMRQHDTAIAEFERASELNPNFTNWRYPLSLVYAGEPERAIEALGAHMRLDPFYEPYALSTLGLAYYLLKRYAEALPHLRACVSRAPNMPAGRKGLAATYAQLGQLDDARAQAAEVLRVEPFFTIREAPPVIAFKRPEDAEHLSTGLQKAGLPKGA
jgi:adenylate cyclase